MEVRDAVPRVPQCTHDEGSVPLNDRYFDEMRRKKAASQDQPGNGMPMQPALPALLPAEPGSVTAQWGVTAERPPWSAPTVDVAAPAETALADPARASIASSSPGLPHGELSMTADASTRVAHRSDAVEHVAFTAADVPTSSNVPEAYAPDSRGDAARNGPSGLRAATVPVTGDARGAGKQHGDDVRGEESLATRLSPDDRLSPPPGGEQALRAMQRHDAGHGQSLEGEAKREGENVANRKVHDASVSQRVAANSEAVRHQSALVYRLNTWGPQHSVNITLGGRDVTLRGTSPSVVAALAAAEAPSDIDARYLVEAAVDQGDGDHRRGERRSRR